MATESKKDDNVLVAAKFAVERQTVEEFDRIADSIGLSRAKLLSVVFRQFVRAQKPGEPLVLEVEAVR